MTLAPRVLAALLLLAALSFASGCVRQIPMPEIRARYRCTEETAIIGESLAGLFIRETFFLEPGLFDTSIAISPSLWWNNAALERGANAWLRKVLGPR